MIILFPKPQKNPQDCNNYRPISLLPTISKVLKIVIKNRLLTFLEANNINSTAQSGFMAKRRTWDELFKITQLGKQALNDPKNRQIF
eukprot:Pgem_evm2s5397